MSDETLNQEINSIKDIDSATDFELKHTPNVQVEEGEGGLVLKVSMGLKGITHPQVEEHYIEWYKVYDGDEMIAEQLFTAADEPTATFEVPKGENLAVRSLCNLHGIWEAKV